MRVPNWYRNERDGVRFYQAWNLHASGLVDHGFSTRLGGASEGRFTSLNLSLAVGDEAERVIANRRAFAAAVGVDVEKIVVADQVHGNTVKVVTERDAGSGAFDHAGAVAETDALITNVPRLPLALHFADCVCILLLDPANKAIGAVHAGWRGTARKIVVEAVRAMTREYGTEPAHLLAAISPAIGRHCYDVGHDTALELFKAFPGDERVISPHSPDKWRADLKTANLILLRQLGVPEPGIAISDECTSCNAGDFSAIAEMAKPGEWAAGLH